VLRSHDADDQLAIEVLRFSTSEVLDGELNGDVLTTSFSFMDEYGDETTDDGQAGTTEYTSYVDVTDDSGTLYLSLPAEWADIDGAPFPLDDGTQAYSVIASTSVADYQASWTVPGVQFIASTTLAALTPDELLDLVTPTDCTSQGRDDYDDGFFTGRYEVFGGCGGTTTQYYLVASKAADSAYATIVAVQVVSDADLAALDEILGSFSLSV
jgi:serine protease Do